jgi:hypothetical protein
MKSEGSLGTLSSDFGSSSDFDSPVVSLDPVESLGPWYMPQLVID